MKNLLIASLALASTYSFAETSPLPHLEITNITYPENQMRIQCRDESCENLDIFYILNGRTTVKAKFSNTDLKNIVSPPKLPRGDGSYTPYELTENLSQQVKQNHREGYNGLMIGNSLLVGLTSVLETIALPAAGIDAIADNMNYQPRDEIRGAKMLLRNLHSPLTEMKVKHKYFLQMKNVLNHATPVVDADTLVGSYIQSSSSRKTCIFVVNNNEISTDVIYGQTTRSFMFFDAENFEEFDTNLNIAIEKGRCH